MIFSDHQLAVFQYSVIDQVVHALTCWNLAETYWLDEQTCNLLED